MKLSTKLIISGKVRDFSSISTSAGPVRKSQGRLNIDLRADGGRKLKFDIMVRGPVPTRHTLGWPEEVSSGRSSH